MHHLPILTLVLENIRRLCKGYAHPTAGKGVDRFDARHPSKLVIGMDRNLAGLDVHSVCVLKDIYPTRPNFVPAGNCLPIWVNALHPIRLQPYGIHHVDAQVLHCLVKVEVCTLDLFLCCHLCLRFFYSCFCPIQPSITAYPQKIRS